MRPYLYEADPSDPDLLYPDRAALPFSVIYCIPAKDFIALKALQFKKKKIFNNKRHLKVTGVIYL